MTPTDVANLALLEIGQRIKIASFNDGSPAGTVAATFYTPKIQMLLRSAHWDFARAQIGLTQWKAVLINGQLSTNPPPQPWQFSYLYPADCVKLRFMQPTIVTAVNSAEVINTGPQYFPYPRVPTACPFVPATDFDAYGNPIRVALSNVYQVQGIYTRDLSQTPDTWDPLFLAAATALLASYFISALARNGEQMNQQIALAKSVIDQARVSNGNESISNVDHTPDWIRGRRMTGIPWMWETSANGPITYASYESCAFPDGVFY